MQRALLLVWLTAHAACAAAAQQPVAFVATADQLHRALAAPARHIVVTAHLRLDGDSNADPARFAAVTAATQSIRGECAEAATGTPPQRLDAKQCELSITGRTALDLSQSGNTSISNLAFVATNLPDPGPVPFPVLRLKGLNEQLWLRNVSVRMHNEGPMESLHMQECARCACAGCDFSGFPGGSRVELRMDNDVSKPSRAVAARPPSLALLDTTLRAQGGPRSGSVEDSARRVENPVLVHAQNGRLLLRSTQFPRFLGARGVTAPASVTVFSDSRRLVQDFARATSQGGATPAAPLPPPADWADEGFITFDDAWLVGVDQEVHDARQAPGTVQEGGASAQKVPPPQPMQSSLVIGLSSVGVAAVVGVLALASVALWHRRRRATRQRGSGGDTAATTVSFPRDQAQPERGDERRQHLAALHLPPLQTLLEAGETPSERARHTQSLSQSLDATASLCSSCTVCSSPSVASPGGGVRGSEGVAALERALDRLHARHERFCGQYVVRSFVARRHGGDGCVQFMRNAGTGADVAVKFFATNNVAVFERERDILERRELQHVLPRLVTVQANADGRVTDGRGYVFPPFLITEKGESLNEWTSRARPDMPTSLIVLLHTARALQRVHACAICHRDIKPANIVWLPSRNAWGLLDFGSAAATGSKAKLVCTLQYAAPETVAASEAAASGVTANPATDIWALGIVAFELLTGRRVFAVGNTISREFREQLRGAALLPWEGCNSRETVRQLRALRHSVLACVHRDPARRPTAAELYGMWDSLFAEATATASQSSAAPREGGESSAGVEAV